MTRTLQVLTRARFKVVDFHKDGIFRLITMFGHVLMCQVRGSIHAQDKLISHAECVGTVLKTLHQRSDICGFNGMILKDILGHLLVKRPK